MGLHLQNREQRKLSLVHSFSMMNHRRDEQLYRWQFKRDMKGVVIRKLQSTIKHYGEGGFQRPAKRAEADGRIIWR